MKRHLVLGTLLVVGTLSLSLHALQAPAQAPRVVDVQTIRDNLYVLLGGGGNTAVFVGSDGVTVVDSKLPGWGQPLLEKIKTLTDKPIVRLINTHTHFDHVGGNVDFPGNVEVVTQADTRRLMNEWRPVTGLPANAIGTSPFVEHGGHGLPTRTFTDRLTIGRGADEINLLHFGAAHTGGDAFVIFKALRVMHTGDAFHTRDLPIMDKNNGGSGVDYARTLSRAADAAKDVDTIINGHNPVTTTVADLRTQSAFVADFVAFVQAAKKSGKTVEDVVKTWETPAKYAGYAKPAEGRVRANAQVVWDETR
ncbi:MAG: MBL fold metallo-hydrolase [Vicinamibacterales bacterium]